ncbi:hypothetical protein G9A89_011406 [Geosiphon pyriformis]|nr:hypothetical protein G9A89_011406 [Geosiphon pyriformis]
MLIALVKFESFEVASSVASKWFVFMGKNSVYVALAINDKQSWTLRDQYRVLLYTLPVRTTAHNLSDLLNSYGRKTCFIGRNPSSYICNKCAVICFENETFRVAAIDSTSVFKSVNLHWAGLFLACCAQYKQFGHVSVDYAVGENCGGHSKQVAQVASGSSSLMVSLFSLGTGSSFGAKFSPGAISSSYISAPLGISGLYNHLASLKCSLELLANQVFSVMKKFSFVELVPLLFVFQVLSLAIFVSSALGLISDMVLDGVLVSSVLFFSAVDDNVSGFSSNSSKVLTTKVGGLESKLVSLEASISSVLVRLDCLCSVSGALLLSLFQ